MSVVVPYLDAFFVSAPAGLVILDSDLSVVRANTTIADMVGVSPLDIIGRTPASLAPQLAPIIEPLLKHVLSTGVPTLNFPITGQTPKQLGITRNWIASVFPVNTPGTARRDVGAIVVEVTDSVRLEQVTRSAALLAEAEELASLGSWELNLLTGRRTLSANFCRVLGLGPFETQFTDSDLWDLIHPDDRDQVRSIIDDSMKAAKPYEFEARFVLRNGTERVLQTRGRPVLDAAGRVVKRVGVTQDITELKRTEKLLRRQEETVRGLFQIAQRLTHTLDLDAILDALNLGAMMLIGTDSSCSGLRTYEGFSCRSFFENCVSKAVNLAWSPGIGIPGWVLQHRQSYLTNDSARDPHVSPQFLRTVHARNIWDARCAWMAF